MQKKAYKIFELLIEEHLLPHLKADDILVLDNRRAHKSEKVENLVEAVRARVAYLPPYSPDLPPIEQMWSKVKPVLKKSESSFFTSNFIIKVDFE